MIIGTTIIELIRHGFGLEISSERLAYIPAQFVNALTYMIWGNILYYFIKKYLVD